MSNDFQREYLVRLPLPLAQLYSRAHNAPAARARHDNTFYLFEALIKLAACPLVAAYLDEVEKGGQRVEALDRLLAQLALPSLGQWVAILREVSKHFGKRPDSASHPLGHLWKQLDEKHRDRPAMLALYRRIKNGADGQPAGDQSCSLLQLFEALVVYRNGVFGHGAGRFEAFFEKEMGPLLFPAVNEVLGEGMFRLLGPAGARLVYLSELRTIDEDRVEMSLSELVGLQSERMAPLEVSSEEAAGLVPNCVAVSWPGRKAPVRLDPLLVFRSSELTDEVLFLNRDRNGKQVEFLSYSTGRTERDKSMAPAMARLLSRITGRDVSEDELDQLQQQSLAETPSVEALFDAGPTAKRVVGDYEIMAKLGSGGMGVVYLARQLSLGRLIALKMLPADLSGDEVALARLRREMRALGRCEHPNIVKVLASGTLPDGQLYYAMEYIPGADLEHVWRELSNSDAGNNSSDLGGSTWARAIITASRKQREETARRATGETTSARKQDDTSPESESLTDSSADLPEIEDLTLPPLPKLPSDDEEPGKYTRRVARMIRDAALAGQAVHDQNIVHRDIKPANLMLTPDGSRVVLMDFGLAKGQSLSLTASRAGGLLGTLRYAAPEQLAAAKLKVGPQADVHALGVTLWELLTRRRFHGDAEDENQLTSWVLTKDPPLLRGVDTTIDRDLEAIVARATEREVDRRIQTAREMAEYLDLYLEGKPLPIRPPTFGELALRWGRKHRWALSAATAALLIVIATAVVSFILILKSRDETLTANTQLDATNQTLEQTNRDLEESIKETEEARGETLAANVQLDATNQTLEKANSELEEAVTETAAARDAERAAKEEALTAKQIAEKRLLRSERLLYANQIASAQREWEHGNAAIAWHHLDSCRWDFRGWEHDYLYTLFNQNHITLKGHVGTIGSVAFSPDGRQVVSGGYDHTIKVWDASSGRELRTIRGHTGWVNCVAFSGDGQRIVSGSQDKTIKVWNATTGREIRTISGHASSITSMSLSPDDKRIVSGSRDKIKIWDADTGDEVVVLDVSSGVSSVSFSSDGTRIVSGSTDNTIKVWDAFTGRELLSFGGLAVPAFGSPSGSGLDFEFSASFSSNGRSIVSGGTDCIKIWDASSGREKLTLGTQAGYCVSFSPDGKRIASNSGRTVSVWNASTGQKMFDLQGHTSGVSSVSFSADGTRIVSAGTTDEMIKVWDATIAQETLTLKGHTRRVDRVSFDPSGKRIVSSSLQDGTIRVWNVSTGKEMLELHPGAGSMSFTPDGRRIVAGIADNTIRVWNATTGEQLLTLRGHTDQVTSICVSRDGTRIVSSAGNAIKLWDADSGQEVRTLKGHSGVVSSVSISPDGDRIVSGGGTYFEPGEVRIWDASTGEEKLSLKGHTDAVSSVSFDSAGKRVVSASRDRTIKVWDVTTGREVLTLAGHAANVSSASFSEDGQRIVSGSEDTTIKVWDAISGQEMLTLRGHTEDVLYVSFSPDDKRIVSGGYDYSIMVWNATMSQQIRTIRGHSSSVSSASFSPDGTRIVSGSSDNTIKIWNATTGQETLTLNGHSDVVTSVSFNATGDQIVSGSKDKTIRFWDADTGQRHSTLNGHTDKISSVSVSSDGRRVASGSADNTVKVWDAVTGTEIRTLVGHTEKVNSVSFGPNGERIASGSDDKTIRIWDATTDKATLALKGHTGAVTSVCFHRGGTWVVSGSLDGTIKVWDASTGEEVRTLKEHAGGVLSVSLTKDGRRIISGGYDQAIRVWDPTTGEETHTLQGHKQRIWSVSPNPTGDRIISGSGDETIKVWSLNEDQTR